MLGNIFMNLPLITAEGSQERFLFRAVYMQNNSDLFNVFLYRKILFYQSTITKTGETNSVLSNKTKQRLISFGQDKAICGLHNCR